MASKSAETLLRQQYLIPRSAVQKVKGIAREQRVSVAEIVRRAIEDYQPRSATMNEAEFLAFMDQLDQVTAETLMRLDRINSGLEKSRAARESGETRAQVRAEIEDWARKNPDLVDQFARYFFGDRESDKAPSHLLNVG